MIEKTTDLQITSSAQKKRSFFASNEDIYSLSLKILPDAIKMMSSKEQREIKNALREIDDLLYTLICNQNENSQANYSSANNPPDPTPQADPMPQADPRVTKQKLTK